MPITGKAKLAGVFGWPVGHSLSPRLHGFWLQRYGIDGAYVPLAVEPDDFETALRALPKLGFLGANVTVPHKEAALVICDEVDILAKRIGAVNTVFVTPEGRLRGSNTDAFGFLENLTQEAPAWRADGGPAVVIGAGGAARAVIVALVDAGVPEVRLANRTYERAETLARDLGGPITVIPWPERTESLGGTNLLVNTTTQGMSGTPSLDLNLEALPGNALVTDIIYTPLKTKLLGDAQTRGNPTVDGLGMLLHQARPGFAQWFGYEPEVDTELRSFVLSGLAG